MYLTLSYIHPFDPFLSIFQTTITPILLNPHISIHPTLIHIYPFLSSIYLHLSFSIVYLYTSILFYLPPIHVNSFLSLLQSLISNLCLFRILFIFLNLYLLTHINTFLSFLQYKSPSSFRIPVSLSKSIPSLSTSIFFYPLSI